VIFAAIINVTTAAQLVAAIDNASPGDEIVLADGTYALTANVNCDTAGTAMQPIIVRAATPLGAEIELDTTEGFKVTAPHWQFDGLDIVGVCATDASCEHAFHVMGAADDFTLRNSRVRDFNAQLKVNATMIGGAYVQPHRGLVAYNEIGDTRARNVTNNPVTKLNIDTGDDWVVRGNYLHDARKDGGDNISYLAFMKSGGRRGLFERNLVICTREHTGGTRIGLSFGGGGTGNEFCAPAFDANVACSTEHTGGTMRNNIIVNCSDVGIYLNEAAESHILYNTLIGTTGIDFRFATTSGDAIGNLMTSVPRTRDGATMNATGNMTNVDVAQFDTWYLTPLMGDLSVTGDVSTLIGAGPTDASVTNDYCAKPRPVGSPYTLGALEHSVTPGCDTRRPPVSTNDPPPGTVDAGPNFAADDFPRMDPPESGCCQTQSRPDLSAILGLFALSWLLRRRRANTSRARGMLSM
jgi:uncharacterized protein (TIGR03382 family)